MMQLERFFVIIFAKKKCAINFITILSNFIKQREKIKKKKE